MFFELTNQCRKMTFFFRRIRKRVSPSSANLENTNRNPQNMLTASALLKQIRCSRPILDRE